MDLYGPSKLVFEPLSRAASHPWIAFSGFLSTTMLSKMMPLSMVQMSMPMESMVGI